MTNAFCGSGVVLKIYFEHLERSLKDELRRRRKHKNYFFSEEQSNNIDWLSLENSDQFDQRFEAFAWFEAISWINTIRKHTYRWRLSHETSLKSFTESFKLVSSSHPWKSNTQSRIRNPLQSLYFKMSFPQKNTISFLWPLQRRHLGSRYDLTVMCDNKKSIVILWLLKIHRKNSINPNGYVLATKS